MHASTTAVRLLRSELSRLLTLPAIAWLARGLSIAILIVSTSVVVSTLATEGDAQELLAKANAVSGPIVTILSAVLGAVGVGSDLEHGRSDGWALAVPRQRQRLLVGLLPLAVLVACASFVGHLAATSIGFLLIGSDADLHGALAVGLADTGAQILVALLAAGAAAASRSVPSAIAALAGVLYILPAGASVLIAAGVPMWLGDALPVVAVQAVTTPPGMPPVPFPAAPAANLGAGVGWISLLTWALAAVVFALVRLTAQPDAASVRKRSSNRFSPRAAVADEGVRPTRILAAEFHRLATTPLTVGAAIIGFLAFIVPAVVRALVIGPASVEGLPQSPAEIALATPLEQSTAVTVGLTTAFLPFAVLGASTLGRAFSTGEIGTSLIAAPRRLSLLLATILATATTVFSISLLGLLAAALVVTPLQLQLGWPAHWSEPALWQSVFRAAFACAVASVIATALGAITRSSIGALALFMVLYFALPTALAVLETTTQDTSLVWVTNIAAVLPNSDEAFVRPVEASNVDLPIIWDNGIVRLDSAMTFGMLCAWCVFLVTLSAGNMKARDVL